jgi:hypothetical protein
MAIRCTAEFCPRFLVWGGRNWLHRCRTTGTTSQHGFLSGASSTFAGPYWGSCWHPSDLLMVHHVVLSACRSLRLKEELPGLFLIIHWWIPHGTLVCRSSQRGLSIGPSRFCTWDCGQRCLSILGAVWPLPMGPMSWSFSCSQNGWIPASCSYSHSSAYLLDACPCLDFVAVGTLHLGFHFFLSGHCPDFVDIHLGDKSIYISCLDS